MKRLLVLLVTIIILGLGIILWFRNGTLPVSPGNTTAKIFVVGKGMGIREIANNLKSQGLIRDPIIFFLLTKKMGVDKEIQAGDFRLNSSMNMYEVIQNLEHGTLDIWTTIPEGLRAAEIADLLKEKIPTYKESWRTQLDENEGYLFPDTYLIPRDADGALIISLFKNNFAKKFNGVKDTKTTVLTDSQTLIIASIIEREAIFNEDRSTVASVIMNRLNLGMALQIDPTVQYAIGYQPATKKWWKKELSFDDLKINSPYNTYKNIGLPPTPISNPGLSAIKAALAPTKTNYLYYYSDNKGHLHFASTLEGHQENIKKYGPQT